MGVVDQSWVTVALTDAHAEKAIVLAKSLRNSATTRRLSVIFSKNVSDKMKNVLLRTFDQCLRLEHSHELNGISEELYAKILLWNLPFLKKCIFLHPDVLVLKNSDELFGFSGISAPMDSNNGLDTGLLIIEPNFTAHEKLMEWMKAGKHEAEGDMEQRYSKWMKLQTGFSELPGKYYVSLAPGEKPVALTESAVSILRFQKGHPLDMKNRSISASTVNAGIFERAVYAFYAKLYQESFAEHTMLLEPEPLPTVSRALLDNGQEPIAIIGMSCRFPMADNVDEYWDVLVNGKDCIRRVPEDRWPSATDEDFRGIQAGFLKCPVDEFDGKFFNISPFELTHMDPQQRLLLEVTWEALEDAGINPQILRGTQTSVYLGTWLQDYRELIRNDQGEFTDFHRTYLGNSLGGSGGRLSFFLGLTGPNIATESGCSSGMAALVLSCEALRKGRSDIALAAGANLLLYPFQKKHMVNVVSPDGRCKTFDEAADGFGRAEGVATLVLKRYSDALKSGDNVLALIRGCGLSQEGTSRSLGTPTKEVQEIAMKVALEDAGISPTDVTFVEAHGTGTPVGDPIELAAISSIYCKNQQREKPLFVASGKTMIGHTESCSGLAGIIKVILSMKNDVIPPHLHLQNLNPHIRIDDLPLQIPTAAVKWEKIPGKTRFAGVSSFGITGTDSHVIIQEPPEYNPPKLALEVEDRPLHLLTFSGKSESALNDVLNSFTGFLETNQDVNLADAAHTLNDGRAHFMHRVAVTANSVEDLLKKVKAAGKGSKLIPEAQPKLCFLFTGQGSQYVGMAKTLYETNAVFKMYFDQCDMLLQDMFQISIKPVVWGQVENETLHRTLYSQSSIFCIEYCLLKLWESWGIKPDAVIGHSLGEFAATVAAGLVDFRDALTLVAVRSKLVEAMCKEGKMIVIKADEKTVDGFRQEFLHNNKNAWLDFAAVNASDQTVLAGPPPVVDAFAMYCTERNLKAHILDATNAFHSRDMDDIIQEYEKVTRNIKPPPSTSPSACTYYSGLKGAACQANEINSDYWLQHSRDRVRFMAACKVAYEDGCRAFLEVGPQPILCALTMKNISGERAYEEPITLLPSIRRKEGEWSTLLETLTKLYQLGFSVDWKGFDQFYNRRKIKLPTYPFNRKKHWFEPKNNKQGITLNGKSLHPLLGCQIPNATTTSIFQSTLELDKLPYLKDHAIGGQVVFPAAGFLEVALKSGNLSTIGEINADEDLMNPISVEKLMIEAPLGLYENEPCQMQTVVMKMESAENKVSIYTQQKNSGTKEGGMASVKWIRQASGTFVPLQASVAQQNNESATDSLQDIKDRCAHEIDTNEFYDKLTTVGLEFGTTFRSLAKVWRNAKDKNEILTQILYPSSSTTTDGNNNTNGSGNKTHYICHPVVLDALIQTIMLGKEDDVQKLQLFVPVLIDKMIVLSKADFSNSSDSPTLPELYAHCKWEVNQGVETRSAILYSASGKVLAVMSGVQMIQTTSEVILKTLSNQQLVVPDMYEEIWAPKSGPFKNRANLLPLEGIFSEPSNPEIDALNLLSDQERRCVERRNNLVYHYILKAFYELGWKPLEMLGETFTVERFMEQHGILKSYVMLMQRFLQIFVEEGILEAITEGEHLFRMIKLPSSQVEAENMVEQLTLESEKEETVDFQVIQACGEKLKNILCGKISALSVLFPEEKGSTVSAETFYNNCIMVPKFNTAIHHAFHQIVQQHASLPEEERGVIRILEVGAGTGASTKVVLPIFEKFGTKFQYTYTDISPVFFQKAKEMFQGYGKKIQYKVLNIENDGLEQGFTPQYFDIVFASNVLHATRSLSESVRNARMLVKDNGFLILGETMREIRDFDVIFGLLDSYWRFTDLDVRQSYPCVGPSVWRKVFTNEGFDEFKGDLAFDGRLAVLVGRARSNYKFDSIAQASSTQEKSKWWLVFSSEKRYRKYFQHRMEKFGRKILLVTMSEPASSASFVEVSKNHFEVRVEEKEDFQKLFSIIKERELSIEGILYGWGLEPETEILRRTHGFLFLSQILLSDFKGLPRLIVPTEGIIRIDDESATDISSASIHGMAKTLRTEHFNLHVKSIDLDPDEMDENVKYDELLTEFWNDDQEFQIAYRQRNRHVARLITCKDFASPLLLPKCERFSLLLPKVTKNIADLKFCPNGKSPLKENEIEVKVRAYGLNFRDIFTVLKPNEEFEKWNTMGLEFSGTVVSIGEKVQRWKIGDYVIGCNFAGGALPSHLSMEEDMVFAMPDQVTFCEAATIPAAFATVYYCLVMIADLKRGENVLIHAGSGGVGLFAIQVAKALGANIITTAGSRRKRTFLRNLGISHVFHSRNTDYGKQILEVTGGEGVHVVLNSLTSPGFKEASLGCCAQGARFVEMSRLHIWTPEDVHALRPDVKYTAVDLTKVGRDVWQAVWRAVDEYMDRGHLKSIPFIQYDATCIREALTYMQKAKHIGKIIITMPDMIQKENELIPTNYLFSDRATYLITGGLGGIGMELAKWMCRLGAKHLVLTSRSSPDERAVKIINDLNSNGYHLVPLCVDVGDYQQCEKLLNDMADPKLKLPKLRGIFHLAGCLRDATYTNQTMEMYKAVFRGKVHGAINLHNLTRDYNLEFFNMFSSMVSIFGPIGQSGYCSANAFLDAFCHYRNANGLCAQAGNWGQWAEVGLSKDIKVPAMRPFSPTQGLSGLEIIMRSQKTQVCVFDVEFEIVRKITANIGAYLEELKIATETQSVAFDVKINNFWEDFNGAEGETGKQDVIKSYVCQILRQILKLDEDESIDENQKFSEMGMDSLMMLEMKNFLQTMLGKNITMNVSELAELTTLNKLASHLMGLIKTANGGGNEGETKQAEEEEDDKSYNFFTPSQRALIEEDMILPEHVRAQDDVGAMCKRSDIKTVLLTGVTGKLGPYMLSALASYPLERIICLIRSKDDASARDRLIKVLREKNLALDMSRVECVAGDITEGNMSLSQEKYDELATAVDAVVHVAVKGNLMEPYMKKEGRIRSDLRTVNVIGTRNVLEFSARQKTKHVLHASTLLACHKVAPNGLLLEDWCHTQDVYEMPNVGYPISKFICERLAAQAVDRGISVHVHRFPALSGDKNGCFSFPNNHAMLRLLGFCKLGVMPANPVPLQVLAVDQAADTSCRLFFNDAAPSDVYNITNPHTCVLQAFPELAKEFGFEIDVVEYEEFFQRLQQNDEYASLFPYRKVDFDGGRFVDFTTSPVALQCWINNPERFFVSEKLQRFLPDYEKTEQPMDILRKDMQFAKDTNIFKRFGL